jgi:hypothetical protein
VSQLSTSHVASLQNVWSAVGSVRFQMRVGVTVSRGDECGGRRRDGSVLVPQGEWERREMAVELRRV